VTIVAAVEMSRSGTLILMSTAVRHLTPPELNGLYRYMAAAFGGPYNPAEREANPPNLDCDCDRHLWVTRF